MCPKCTAKQQAKYKLAKAERQKRKEAKQDENWRRGAINEPNALLEDFMTWEEHKELWEKITGRIPKFERYLKDKEEFMERQRRDRRELKPSDTRSIIMNVPLNPRRGGCIKNRKMWLGLIPRDAFDIQNHCSCRYCKVWKRYNKAQLLLGGIQGVRLWKSGIGE